MVFYLIRHGQTAWNAQFKVMGRQETALNDTGEKQAQALADKLVHFPIGQIYSSPQLRAQQTAQKISVLKKIPVLSDDRLAEVDFRLWEGKTRDELYKDEHYLDRKKNFFTFSHEKVESFESLFTRVKDFIRTVGVGNHHVAVVSHADVVKAMIVALMNGPVETFFQYKVQNASCTIMKQVQDRWEMELLNYTPDPWVSLDI